MAKTLDPSHLKEENSMAFSMYDASVQISAQQLGALATIIDKTAAHCEANKIERN